MKKTILFRQGDVLVARIASFPSGLPKLPRENGTVVLARGEVTGHAHVIADDQCDLFQSTSEAGVTFLEVRAAMAALTHEEHATIKLPAGKYSVVRQREYSPQGERRVTD